MSMIQVMQQLTIEYFKSITNNKLIKTLWARLAWTFSNAGSTFSEKKDWRSEDRVWGSVDKERIRRKSKENEEYLEISLFTGFFAAFPISFCMWMPSFSIRHSTNSLVDDKRWSKTTAILRRNCSEFHAWLCGLCILQDDATCSDIHHPEKVDGYLLLMMMRIHKRNCGRSHFYQSPQMCRSE